jgi:hypothetical protein
MKTLFFYFVIALGFISCGLNKEKEITQAKFKQMLAANSISSIRLNNNDPAKIYGKPFRENDKPYILRIESSKSFEDSLDIIIETLSKKDIHPKYNYLYVSGGGKVVTTVFPLFNLIILILWFILFIYAIIDVLKNKFEPENNKIIWVIVVILLPILGPVLYFFIGKKQKLLK